MGPQPGGQPQVPLSARDAKYWFRAQGSSAPGAQGLGADGRGTPELKRTRVRKEHKRRLHDGTAPSRDVKQPSAHACTAHSSPLFAFHAMQIAQMYVPQRCGMPFILHASPCAPRSQPQQRGHRSAVVPSNAGPQRPAHHVCCIRATKGLAEHLGKTVSLSLDRPGFIVSMGELWVALHAHRVIVVWSHTTAAVWYR